MLPELQDRWTSLLYDPVVSAQASAHMVKVEVEPSGFNQLSKISKLDDLKGNRKTHEKREVGSICVQYYRMRKRIKDELLYSPDVSFFEKCNSSSTVTEGDILCTLNTEDTIDANVVEEVKHSLFHGDEQDVCQWEADDGLTSISHLESVQLNEGKVFCILNTEESVIPCNDDIFFLIHPSSSVTPQITKKSIDPLSSFVDEKDGLHGLTWSKMNGPDLSSKFDSIHQHSYTFKSDLADTKCLHPLSGQPDMIRNAGHSQAMHINSLLTGNRVLAKKILQLDLEYAQGSCLTSEEEALALMVNVKPSGFNPSSTVCRLDDLKGNEKTREKRKKGSICIQYYRKRKRIKYDLFNSVGFELKQDSAKSSTVTEGDIICSLNTEDTMDDIPDSQLLDSPENVLEDSLLLAATPRTECDEESKDSSFHGDEQDVCRWEADVAVTSKSRLNSVQLSEWKFICILNTEDSEIPCNDDILLHIHQSSDFDNTFRSELVDNRCLHPHFGQPDKITNPVVTVKREQGLDTSATYCDMSLWAEDESMDNYPSISDHNNSDSDDGLPCFSDIEALIHRIDLEYAEESYITSEVGRHRHNYSKRTITRLEQTALSSLQSAMSSLGALAVFYSRCFNYYIKKTEVTVGRSTKDTDVDIDLRKAGHANMISRLQATIKMKIDGSFTLKNIGKSSISINGNSIAHGEVAALGSSCLIEISGMKFMFEINERYVRRYLDNLIKENQGASRTFNWSPEGEP